MFIDKCKCRSIKLNFWGVWMKSWLLIRRQCILVISYNSQCKLTKKKRLSGLLEILTSFEKSEDKKLYCWIQALIYWPSDPPYPSSGYTRLLMYNLLQYITLVCLSGVFFELDVVFTDVRPLHDRRLWERERGGGGVEDTRREEEEELYTQKRRRR